ncbi:hypothetical protein B9X79_11650 [Acinetobacter pittii]|nr:hypothetical protein B9X79_11650 [Acinetobacter pittii]
MAFFYARKNPNLSIYQKLYFATSIVAQVVFFYTCKKPKVINLSKALLRHFSHGSGGVFYACIKISLNIIHYGLGLYQVTPQALAALSKGHEFHSWNICLRFDTCLN